MFEPKFESNPSQAIGTAVVGEDEANRDNDNDL